MLFLISVFPSLWFPVIYQIFIQITMHNFYSIQHHFLPSILTSIIRLSELVQMLDILAVCQKPADIFEPMGKLLLYSLTSR